jgi:hypothetical protein
VSKQYPVYQSRLARSFLLAIYGVSILAVVIFISSAWLKILLSLLLFLLLVVDLQRLNNNRAETLILNDQTGRIDFAQAQQNEGYEQYKLFSNRWFLILQLKNAHSSKNLLLLADRFRSINEYLQFRYQIINMSRNQNVA